MPITAPVAPWRARAAEGVRDDHRQRRAGQLAVPDPPPPQPAGQDPAGMQLTMTSGGLRLLQDLRRFALDPPRQLRPRSAAITQPEDQPETVRATA